MTIAPRGRGAWSRPARAIAIGMAALLPGGCEGVQHALDPAGVQAESIAQLWWVMFAIAALVTIAVAGVLLVALFRRRDVAADEAAQDARDMGERGPDDGGTGRIVIGAVAATVAILVGVLIYDLVLTRGIVRLGGDGALEVEIIGHQYWWEIRYPDPLAERVVITANELHIPVGEPVHIRLRSRDVIHSFWVPNLHGKIDLVPGRENSLRLQADVAGAWRGQCAEYCGLQHANMAMRVVAMEPADFETWLAAQRMPAQPPADSIGERGREVFLGAQCAYCHRVRGTPAQGAVAPDLTHLASRATLAAGTLPNTRGHLAGWILAPQGIKPGSRMPSTPLESDDLLALLAWLETLR